jgi:hypothetical protein
MYLKKQSNKTELYTFAWDILKCKLYFSAGNYKSNPIYTENDPILLYEPL